MGCKIIYKGISYDESEFKNQINRYISINQLFESDNNLANQVYEALGFNNLKNSTENTLLYDNAIEKIRSLINTKIGKYLPTDIPRSKFDENKKGVILNYNKSVFNELFDIVTEIVENYSDFKYSVNNAVRLSQIKKLEEGELYSNFREIDVLIEKLKNLGVNTPTDLFQTIYNKIDEIKQISDSIDRNESLPRFEKIQKIADIRVNLDKFLTDYLENIINPSRIFKDYFIKPLDLNNQITPQQKQQALQAYSKYLDSKGINIEEGNLRNQIQNIASNSQYEHNKRLAEYLLDFNFDKNDFFRFAEDFAEDFEEFGLYYKDENGVKNISIKANKIAKEIPLSNRQYFEEQVLLHETIHLLTVDNLDKNKEVRKEISKLMQVAKNKLDTSKYTNAFSSETEFIAHTFSDYNFQKELKSIPYEKSNVWNKFISLIQDMAKYLGINVENSLLEKIVEISQPLFDKKLGTKQDIEGFKEFVNNPNQGTQLSLFDDNIIEELKNNGSIKTKCD
jgi:hypothetical protein